MAAALVQSRAGTISGVSATTTALAYTSNVSAGTLLLTFASWGIATSTITVADSRTNVENGLTKRSDVTNDQDSQAWWAASNGAGADTVTATHSVATTGRELDLAEFSGVVTSGTHAYNGVASQAASTAPATGSITTTVRCLVVSFLNTTDTQAVTSPPSGFTLLTSGAGSVVATAYAVLNAGTYNPTWATALGRCNGDTVAFAETVAAAASVRVRPRAVGRVPVHRASNF